MDFKIDTRDTFSVVTPVCDEITANLADEMRTTIDKMRQRGSHNFIIDLGECGTIAPDAVEALVDLHEECYSMGNSLVFTAVRSKAMSVLKETETDMLLNLAPKMVEAIDIISMEILERDLFSEEG